jgi:hypothetical protein
MSSRSEVLSIYKRFAAMVQLSSLRLFMCSVLTPPESISPRCCMESLLSKLTLLNSLVLVLMLRMAWLSASIVTFSRRSCIDDRRLSSASLLGRGCLHFHLSRQPSAIHCFVGWRSFRRLFDPPPDYSAIRLFGCVCYVLSVPRECTKPSAQSVECVFLG